MQINMKQRYWYLSKPVRLCWSVNTDKDQLGIKNCLSDVCGKEEISVATFLHNLIQSRLQDDKKSIN